MPKSFILATVFILLILISVFFIYTFGLKKPTNDKKWITGQEITAKITRTNNENQLLIDNVRNFRFKYGRPFEFNYQSRAFNLNEIDNVWFLVEPFYGSSGIAHTFFIFDFKDTDPIALSVESRREEGQEYSAVLGAFNNYETIYIWSSEKDVLSRMVSQGSDVYMYRLNITKDSARNLFEQLILETESLEEKPQFYNTLTSNCTNILAKAANKIKTGAIPWHISYILPGFAPAYLYNLGYLETHNLDFKDLKKSSLVTEYVENHIDDVDRAFSIGLRLRDFNKK